MAVEAFDHFITLHIHGQKRMTCNHHGGAGGFLFRRQVNQYGPVTNWNQWLDDHKFLSRR